MLVRSVARGNEYGFESPFVHVTASFDVARRILAERGHLYTGKIVQISLANFHPDHVINLSDARSQRPWLTDENNDDAEMEDYVARSRTYSAKDKELLLLALPRLADIWLSQIENMTPPPNIRFFWHLVLFVIRTLWSAHFRKGCVDPWGGRVAFAAINLSY
jgi:hypothetical protein